MTRRLFAILTLAACLSFAGCGEREWPSVWLEQNSVTISPSSDVTSVGIRSGSGRYRAEISDPAVAYVRVEPTDGAGIRLFIEPESEGEAIITVTDVRSGHYDRCSLTVARYIASFKIADIQWSIDADSPEAIETALKADTSVPPVGGFIRMGAFNINNPDHAEWSFTDTLGEEAAHGTYAIDISGGINPIFRPLMPQTQIVSRIGLVLYDDGGEQREWYKIVSIMPSTRLFLASYQQGFYEDLTEYCQREFPDAGVRSVARVLITYYSVAKNDLHP